MCQAPIRRNITVGVLCVEFAAILCRATQRVLRDHTTHLWPFLAVPQVLSCGWQPAERHAPHNLVLDHGDVVPNNQFSGVLPSTYAVLTNLMHLQAQNNQLHGTLPEAYAFLANLEQFLVNGNN